MKCKVESGAVGERRYVWKDHGGGRNGTRDRYIYGRGGDEW